MPLDPGISLSAGKDDGGYVNPLDTAAKALQLGSAAANLQTTQSTLAARKAMGPIFQRSIDPTSGEIDYNKALSLAGQDPAAAFLVPEMANTIATRELTKTQRGGAMQTQSSEFLKGLSSDIAAAATKPDMLSALVKARAGTVSPEVWAKMYPGISGIVDSLTHGLPDDPKARAAEYGQRAAPFISLLPKESQEAVWGRPTSVDTGGTTQMGSVQVRPGIGGGVGWFTPANSLSMSLKPQVITLPGSTPAITGPGGTTSIIPSPPTSAAHEAPVSGTGKPLWDETTKMEVPKIGTSLGFNVQSANQQEMAKQLSDEFNTTGAKTFGGAQQTLGMLPYMNEALDKMASTGGLLTSGSWGGPRTELGKVVNTLAAMTGQKPPFDPETITSIDSFKKATDQMGTMLTTSLLGQQREAAQTITRLTGAVPGVSNTFMGGKLVASGIEATMQRIVDERNWDNEWQQRNQGNLTGAAEAFNKVHPAREYAEKVLTSYGLTPGGRFSDPTSVQQAYKKGYLSQTQAANILHNQWPENFSAPAKGK